MKENYEQKLMDVLNFAQFIELEGENDKMIVIVENEKKLSSTLLEMMRQELISERMYHRLRTTGAQPARLYELSVSSLVPAQNLGRAKVLCNFLIQLSSFAKKYESIYSPQGLKVQLKSFHTSNESIMVFSKYILVEHCLYISLQ